MTADAGGWTLPAVALATAAATSVGGIAALRLGQAMGLLLGFGAGAVTGVALFDLLPEALQIGGGAVTAATLLAGTAVGFAAYLVFDRAVLHLQPEGAERGHLRAGLLTCHSLMDGLGIGLAFQVSTTAGLILALGVLAHDLLDGANTVVLSLSGGTGARAARRWLAADAVAPAVGMALASRLAVPAPWLALLLAVFAGMFLNIGAGELLPKSHLSRPRFTTTLATLAGMGMIYAAVRLAGGG